MFKNGDRVQIRQWDDMANERGIDPDGDIYGGICGTYFVQDMKHLCGKYATVCDTFDVNVVLEFDEPVENADWTYTVEMIEPIEDDEELAVYWQIDDSKPQSKPTIAAESALAIERAIVALEDEEKRVDLPAKTRCLATRLRNDLVSLCSQYVIPEIVEE